MKAPVYIGGFTQNIIMTNIELIGNINFEITDTYSNIPRTLSMTNCIINTTPNQYFITSHNMYFEGVTLTNNIFEDYNHLFEDASIAHLTTSTVSNNTWNLSNGLGFSQTNLIINSLSNEIITSGNPFVYKPSIIDENPVYGKVQVVSYNSPPNLNVVDSGMQVESDALYTSTKKLQLSAGESILNSKFISNSELAVVTTHGVYKITMDTNTVTILGGMRGNCTASEIYTDYITTWDDAGDLTIWNTSIEKQPGTKILMGFTEYNINEVTNNNNYMVYSTVDSPSDTTPSLYSFTTDGTYKAVAANIAAYKQGTMELSSTDVLAMIRSVTGNTNFPRYNPSTMGLMTAITVPAAPSDLVNILNTDTFIVPTTGATYIYGYNSAGTQTFSAISALTTPLSNPSGTDARNIVGSNNNVVYVIDSAGATIGQFASGAVVQDTAMAKVSGLYFCAGGDDTIFYIFSKFQVSDWTLGQATQMADKISDVDMSPTGIYATCTVQGTMFLWTKSSFVPTPTPTGGGATIQYYLSAQVVDDTAIPLFNETVLIDYTDDDGNVVSETLITDNNGRVVIEVTPTTTYTITLSNGYVYKYTASNLQLQTITLVKAYQAYAPNIDYNVWYDADTETIYMYYEDKANLTDEVTFTIYDDAGTELWSQTEQGSHVNTSHSFATVMRANMYNLRSVQLQDNNLTPEKLGTVYQVNVQGVKTNVDSSSSEVTVKNTWFVGTTNGILNFPVDPVWKNIFFTLLLMVMCGVFGWIGSVKGAVGIAGVAVAFNYLGLISIPLFWLWGIVFFAFLTVYAYASQQEG